MKTEAQILKLAVRKLAREATAEELEELDDFLKQDPDLFTILRLLLADWIIDEPVSKEDIDRSFAKLTERIKSAESH